MKWEYVSGMATTGRGEGLAEVDRHDRMFGVPDRVEPEFLGPAGHEGGIDGVGGQGYREADVHPPDTSQGDPG